MKTKVFPTIAPKILFENTLQPGLHLQDLRNFPMRNLLKEGGVPLSSSTGDPITWRKSIQPPMTPLKKHVSWLSLQQLLPLISVLNISFSPRELGLHLRSVKIESLVDNAILTTTISMHHPPKRIININQATKRWVQPRWGHQESLETTQVLSTDRSWMTSQCLIKYSCSCGRSKKATDVQQFDTDRWTDKLSYLCGWNEPLSLVYPASPILPAVWKLFLPDW